MPRKGGRWWFSWRRRDFPAKEVGDHGPRAGPGWAAGRSSLDGYSPHSAAPRGRKPQCGSSGGKSGLVAGALQLEQELGRMAAGGGWSQHPSPAVGLCHSSITSTPLLFPGTCPHFTDGKTYIHQRSQSQEESIKLSNLSEFWVHWSIRVCAGSWLGNHQPYPESCRQGRSLLQDASASQLSMFPCLEFLFPFLPYLLHLISLLSILSVSLTLPSPLSSSSTLIRVRY